MKSDFIGSLVNRAAVALVFAATALSVDASQIPTDLSLDASREASRSSVVAAASAGPEAFNIPCGLNGLGEDMYLSIVERMANREDITIQDISSFIRTSKRMSKIPNVLKSEGKSQVISLIRDKGYEAMLEYQDSKIENRKMTKNPKLFLKFCKYWLKTADGRMIIEDVCEVRKTAEEAYNDFRTFIEDKKQKAMRPLAHCRFNESLNDTVYSLTNGEAYKLCKEQFDAWLEEDDVAFEHVMQETMDEKEFLGYVNNFGNVLVAIRFFFNSRRNLSSHYLFDEEPFTDQIDSVPKLKRFLLEFFFKKIGKSVYDFVKEEQTVYNSFIHLAAEYSQIEALKYCLDNGVDVNEQIERDEEEAYKKGFTPLMCAVNCGATEAIDFLLQNGANPYLRDVRGRNALDLVHDDDVKGFKIRTILEAWMAAHSQQQ